MRKLMGSPIPGLQAFGRTTDIVSRVLSQGQNELSIMIYGPDLATLDRVARSALPALSQIPGISQPDVNATQAQPQLNVKIDRIRAASLGLSTTAISQAIDTATSGSIATYLQVSATQVPVIVQLPANQRRSYQSLAGMALTVPQGGSGTSLISTTTPTPGQSYDLRTIPLLSVANVSVGSGPSETTRMNKQRETEITAGLNGGALGDVTAAAAQIMDHVTMPTGYHWGFGPGSTQQSSAFSSLGLIVILAIVLIYMLLAAQFESLLHPLVIMTAVPLSLRRRGARARHASFFRSDRIYRRPDAGRHRRKKCNLGGRIYQSAAPPGRAAREALLEAAPLRLRPILMTTLATIGGMTPLTLGLEVGSSSQAPLGTVVIGGLLCSTVLSLIVIPTLYLWVAEHVEPRFAPKPAKGDGRVHIGETANPSPATAH